MLISNDVLIKNKLLFNFAVSYSGGGFKRLYSYAEWFNRHGGAWFIIHSNCSALIGIFPNNRFIVVAASKLKRLFCDCSYLGKIKQEIGVPDLYYSYGIPVYSKVGLINWFHLSNVLPLCFRDIPLSIHDRLQMVFLSSRIKKTFEHVDVVSAESMHSLSLIGQRYATKKCLSVNGSDDELICQDSDPLYASGRVALVMGTYRYKALEDSYQTFKMLQQKNKDLILVIIGNEKAIPSYFRRDKNVVITGYLNRESVIEWLRKTKYYISTTHIENSYNAAAEGIFFANESFISDIEPHRELLAGMPFQTIFVPHMKRPMLHVKKKDISTVNLKTWDYVIRDMMGRVDFAI